MGVFTGVSTGEVALGQYRASPSATGDRYTWLRACMVALSTCTSSHPSVPNALFRTLSQYKRPESHVIAVPQSVQHGRLRSSTVHIGTMLSA
eukprot:1160899-Rhodomonas_salina.1